MNNTILDLSDEDAYHYFMRENVYTTLSLPNYFNFSLILRKIEAEYKSWSIQNPDLTSQEHYKNEVLDPNTKIKPKNLDNTNYSIAINKEGAYSFRRISITNPIIYFHLIKLITYPSNWEIIIKRFKQFQSISNNIAVSSIQNIQADNTAPQTNLVGLSIHGWWRNYELASIRHSLKYEYMLKTDISNFYPSIYVHSLSWAIAGRKTCKEYLHKSAKDFTKELILGKAIEDYILSMQSGETMGIPLGSGVFDFLAELVLGYVDMKITEALRKNSHSDFRILRYRDDYTIFSNDPTELRKIISTMHLVLSELKLTLNDKKTELLSSSTLNIIKKDKLASLMLAQSNSQGILKDTCRILIFTSEHPNSGQLCQMITRLSKKLRQKRHRNEAEKFLPQLIATLCEIALRNRKYAQYPLAIISQLLESTPNTELKCELGQQVVDRFQKQEDIWYLEIWLQRALRPTGLKFNFKEPLCKCITGDNTQIIWNTEWVNSDYLNKIEWDTLDFIDRIALSKTSPAMDIREFSPFDYY